MNFPDLYVYCERIAQFRFTIFSSFTLSPSVPGPFTPLWLTLFYSSYQKNFWVRWYQVGGGVTPAVLPHHRAYGSVPRRFMNHIGFDAVDPAATRAQYYQRNVSGMFHSYEKRRNSTTHLAGLRQTSMNDSHRFHVLSGSWHGF